MHAHETSQEVPRTSWDLLESYESSQSPDQAEIEPKSNLNQARNRAEIESKSSQNRIEIKSKQNQIKIQIQIKIKFKSS